MVRSIGSALALLIFASPLLETFHQTVVRHVSCPEHGEPEELGPQAPHLHGRASRALPALHAEGDPAGPRSEEEGHQHCAVMLHAQVRGRAQVHKTLVAPACEAVVAARRRRELPRPRRLAVYRFAPKASPPLA